MSPSPTVASVAPAQSISWVRDGSRLSSTNSEVTTTTAMASGTLSRKAARQLMRSMSHPPTTGPMAAVIALKPDQMPIAGPRLPSLNVAVMMARLAGTRNAAPTP